MVKIKIIVVLFVYHSFIHGQNKPFAFDNFSVRQTFDGSKNEKKPARIIWFRDNNSGNNYFNVDVGLKVGEFQFFKNNKNLKNNDPKDFNHFFVLYPVLEWHKSTNENTEKDKVTFGINTELLFGHGHWQPYVQSGIKYSRNRLDNVNEFKVINSLTFVADPIPDSKGHLYFPGTSLRYKKDPKDLLFRYYPYIGHEYREMPDLITVGVTEKFSLIFFRLYIEFWLVQSYVELQIDGTYRNLLHNDVQLENNLPMIDLSINWYPMQQDTFGIGLNYQRGYDPDVKFMDIDLTSLSINVKL